ncbi:Adenylyltransferase and sulfurtransferase uba4 [Pleurostoma richardsiae]|uniref:Adenylyltransferase and sulfurtransferase uba4 n=1 Tax=Pleurostoma richardsiae TaxID=41990 RepID=A0AA38S7E3_9PEZI|nr:Adenylyltransferase and sulfurtransferase uba4 [Pleurostoma richardsiae]
MEGAKKSARELREQISRAEKELKSLREQLSRLESEENEGGKTVTEPALDTSSPPWKWPLAAEDYERYGRQLIIPSVGVKGQLRLKASRVLIVGAGGLGCPSAAYIAGAGVGTIGIVDGDTVETSNLHRQIAHGTSRVGMSKVDSAITYLKELNPSVTYIPHHTHLTPTNAGAIVSDYDLVLDCTDHPTSRYLISDACVLLRRPLVSASALRTDGQLMVLNCPPAPQGFVEAGAPPCYRCVFPRPPPPDSVVSCGEGGILGPVVGVMGVLQALEAVRIIAAGLHLPRGAGPDGTEATATSMAPPTLLLFSAGAPGAPSFRSVRMRGRRRDCFACGAGSTLTLETLASGSLDYVAFCGGVREPVRVLGPEERVSAVEYSRAVKGGAEEKEGGEQGKKDHLLLDVREKENFEIASIEGAVNVPFSKIQSWRAGSREGGEDDENEIQPDWIPPDLPPHAPIYVVCRVGNDSQVVARKLKEMGLDRNGERFIGDIRGGMRAWKAEVDETLPFM